MSTRVDSLHVMSESLHALRGSPRKPSGVRLAMEALHSKHEGIQSLGVGLLGEWADPTFVPELRELLQAVSARPRSSGLRRVVIRALARCVSEADAPWVLAYCFDAAGERQRQEGIALVCALPHKVTAARIVLECRSQRVELRRAAVQAVSVLPVAQQEPLSHRLVRDGDSSVRAYARYQLGRMGSSEPPNPSSHRTRYAGR